MDIWQDKRIKDLVNVLKNKKRKNTVSTKKDVTLVAPRFIFVCGKAFEEGKETIREITISRLEHHKGESGYGNETNLALCVISENLYIQDLAADVFSFEKMLAEISQKIIIVVESAGTLCELGAFVMNDECFAKTIVINEDCEKYKESFVTRGPIKMLEDENEDNVILHYGAERIKTSMEFSRRMEEIVNEKLEIPINNDHKEIELKSLIYEIANIVELFQPLEYFEIEELYKEIKGFKSYSIKRTSKHNIKTIKKVVFLMEKMQILIKNKGYYRLNDKISCYNTMFNITRKEYNDLRLVYLNRLHKYQPQRMVNS